MIVEKIALWGKNGRPRFNIALSQEVNVVIVHTDDAWEALCSALQMLSSCGTAGIPCEYRVEVAFLHEDGRRSVVNYDPARGRITEKGKGTTRGEPVTGPSLDCVFLRELKWEQQSGSWIAALPPQYLVGDGIERVQAAYELVASYPAALERAQAEALRHRELAGRIRSLRRSGEQLASKITWLTERIHYISTRAWAADAMLRSCELCNELDHYIAELKHDYAAAFAVLKQIETADSSERRCADDPLLSCPAAVAHRSAEDEIRSLLALLDTEEKKAIDVECKQSRAAARLAAARNGLAEVEAEIGKADARGCDRLGAVQAASIVHSMEQRKREISRMRNELEILPLRRGSHRLGKLMTVAGASIALVSLIALPFVPERVAIAGMNLLGPTLFLSSLAVGMLASVFGLAEGIEAQTGMDRRARIDKELLSLLGQQAWAQQQLKTILGGRDLDAYLQVLATHDEFEAERQQRTFEVNAAMAETARLSNQSDLIRITMVRARERISELVVGTGLGSASVFLDQASRHSGALQAWTSASRECDRATCGNNRHTSGQLPSLILEEIASAESARALAGGYVEPDRVSEISAEYGARLEELEHLREELVMKQAQSEEVRQELATSDLWEQASAHAEALLEVEGLRRHCAAAELAQDYLNGVEDELLRASCSELQGRVSETIRFICDDPEVRLELVPGKHRAELLAWMRRESLGLAQLATAIGVAEARADGVRPLGVVVDGDVGTSGLGNAFEMLGMTRQVIALVRPGCIAKDIEDMGFKRTDIGKSHAGNGVHNGE